MEVVLLNLAAYAVKLVRAICWWVCLVGGVLQIDSWVVLKSGDQPRGARRVMWPRSSSLIESSREQHTPPLLKSPPLFIKRARAPEQELASSPRLPLKKWMIFAQRYET